MVRPRASSSEPPLKPVTGRVTLIALTVGALIGLPFYLARPETFSGWFIGAMAVAGLFFVAAYIRRARWEETSTSVFIGAGFIAWALIDHWLFFAALTVGLGVYYLIASYLAHERAKP